jgi:hypothetical protein
VPPRVPPNRGPGDGFEGCQGRGVGRLHVDGRGADVLVAEDVGNAREGGAGVGELTRPRVPEVVGGDGTKDASRTRRRLDGPP